MEDRFNDPFPNKSIKWLKKFKRQCHRGSDVYLHICDLIQLRKQLNATRYPRVLPLKRARRVIPKVNATDDSKNIRSSEENIHLSNDSNS